MRVERRSGEGVWVWGRTGEGVRVGGEGVKRDDKGRH